MSENRLEYYIANYAMVPAEIPSMENKPVLVDIDPRTNQHLYYQGREIFPLLALITSIFMHGSLLHLAGNMLFLWIFGNNIEDYLGRMRFLIFYFIAGIGASLVHVLFNLGSHQPVIGASGAVSGIMGAYLILYPFARVRTMVFFLLITFIDIPAFVFLVIWFLFQLLFAGAQTGIAWLAHVGGFIIGILLIKFMQRRPNPRKPFIEIVQ